MRSSIGSTGGGQDPQEEHDRILRSCMQDSHEEQVRRAGPKGKRAGPTRRVGQDPQ